MRFSLSAAASLFSLALSMSSAQASPLSKGLQLRATTPAYPSCADFTAACVALCGTRQPTSKCVEGTSGRQPTLQCRCGTGWFADKTAQVVVRVAIAHVAKLAAPAPPVVVPPPVVVLPPVVVAPAPAFINSGFENGLTSWEPRGNAGTCQVKTDGYNGSGHRAVCVHDTPTGGVGVLQTLNGFEATKSYTITFWARRTITTNPTTGADDSAVQALPSFGSNCCSYVSGAPLTTEWTKYSYPVPAVYALGFFVGTYTTPTMEIDDVFVTENTA